jgi:tetratricopeptide (TPR) repeat protein
VNPILRKLVIILCSIVIGLTGSFIVTEALRRTDWFKERTLRQLVTGSPGEKLHAATLLAEIGAENQLLRALREKDPTTREMARRAVEHHWFLAAGPEAFHEMEAAFRAEEREDFRQALQMLDRLIARHPGYAEAWNRRASVHWQMGEHEKSLADCERALLLNPSHYGALQGKGVCLIKQGKIAEAAGVLRAALRIAPHDTLTRQALSQCEELLREKPETQKASGLI